MRKRLWKNAELALCAFLLLSAAAEGARTPARQEKPTPVTLKDFIHAVELKTAMDGAIYRFVLPKSVYEGLVQSQRVDLAVFNASGEVVPFAVTEPPARGTVERAEHAVPFYELPARLESPGASPVGPIDIYVRTGADGQVVSVTGGGGGGEARLYLLDFSSVRLGENALGHTLTLSLPDDVTGLSAQMSFFESSNLRDWSSFLTDAPLIQLRNEDSRLTRDSVELPRAPRRYLLLRIKGAHFSLKGVRYSATLRSASVYEEEGVARPGVALGYDLLGAFPVLKVNFVLREPGFYRARYLSRPQEDGPWQTRGELRLMMIRNPDGSVTSNLPVPVDPRLEHRHWRLEFDGAFSGAPPEMRYFWRPREVFFLAQGRAPYILAFGSSRKGLALQDASFLSGVQATEAEIGPPIDPGKTPDLAPGGEEAGRGETEWQRYLVWALLAFSGSLLSAIAWKLMKSENQ
ncbi:MAG: DUF3999 domain-containing protein [Synergistaceae bacterium]|jgi:hypothetical protein|nr:DUF3999 domain-containing protein [Synergistaceae bacterium]